MRILRCIKKILKTTTTTATTTITTTVAKPPLFSLLFLSPPYRLLSQISPDYAAVNFPFISSGPLFISLPPWQLSHSATPTLVQCDVVLRHPLRILETSKLGFPIELGIRKVVKDKQDSDGDDRGTVERRENIGCGVSGVGGGGFVESFVNWPNFISFSRMVSGPVLGWMIVNEMYLPAFVGLAISGASDWLDGYVARRMGINSVVGSYLDPLADKVLVGCVAVAMVENNLLHPGLVGLVVLRDVMLVGGAVYKRASSLHWQWRSWYDFFNLDGTRPEKVEPLFISKVNTVFQLILIATALLQPELGTPETQAYITYLSWLVASTTVASTAAYGVQHMRNKALSVASSR